VLVLWQILWRGNRKCKWVGATASSNTGKLSLKATHSLWMWRNASASSRVQSAAPAATRRLIAPTGTLLECNSTSSFLKQPDPVHKARLLLFLEMGRISRKARSRKDYCHKTAWEARASDARLARSLARWAISSAQSSQEAVSVPVHRLCSSDRWF
jgi:hypothetical protein